MALTLEQIKALKPNTKVLVKGTWFDDYAEQHHVTERTCILWQRKVDEITATIFPMMAEGGMIGTVIGKNGKPLEEYMNVHEVIAVVVEEA